MPTEDAQYEVRGYFTEDSQYVQIQAWKVFQRTFRKWIGTELVVSIKPLRYKRSESQNRYMWGVVVIYVKNWFEEEQGLELTRDEVYSWLRISLLGQKPKIIEVGGEQIVTMTSKRFSQMTTLEFSSATDTILKEMAIRGCIIPEPKKKGLNLLEDFIIYD